MSSTASLAVLPSRAPAIERALPRADETGTRLGRRRCLRRDRWGSRRWPFGPTATWISLGLHAVALVAIVQVLGAPKEPERIGDHVFVALTPDLGELEEHPLLDLPEVCAELEELEIPTPHLDPELEREETLAALEDVEVATTRESELSLAIVSKRLAPRKVAEEPPPVPAPPPVTVRPPAPPAPPARPRAAPTPRPRGAMPVGRLRPVVKPISYPEAARRAGIQGRARVAMTIDPNGTVVAVDLLASSGYAVLDRAALDSARRWRFAPPGTFRRAAQTFRFALN